ncbi:hypothetical protein JBL43_01585 [Aureibaculum sp. A20]|uniref:Uncharacterized protein n=1 Tax=Aureibaculum flavum TaxID=2795986 RepID=A0ABS0WLS9_9FLAO|nr:hypothetical protein [Aureibaculum flavum]MBJ2172909.1 hypothetical protein [Aureibaculum flavum]
MTKAHTFHIPVMGIGYTIDTPYKVAHLGIDSVISLVDDILLEKLRKMYSEKLEIPYTAITDKINDFRAKRVTSYLNMMNNLVDKKFEELKNSAADVKDYFNRLPDSSSIKKEFKKITANHFNLDDIRTWIDTTITKGSIDVNIMTKVDKDNYIGDEKLPIEFNDAHAALRGFAESDLNASVILSAGMNPRLYAYLENFDAFFPNEKGEVDKKVVLKVSDYRSALIQGKFLAKKGIWVSEYRVESGLNCGGHAFATDGNLLGPILAEFRDHKQEITQTVHELLIKALADKNKTVPKEPLALKITAQGGVGTSEEHDFLLDHYKVDSVGWGTPFLLVPEATTVDVDTLEKLEDAKEKDLYLSNISPLGVPFNNLRGNTKDEQKFKNIAKNRPGSACPKKYVALNYEFDEKGLCTASRQYQHLKLKSLEEQNLSENEHEKEYTKIIEKSCVCVGLGTSSLLSHGVETKKEGTGVSICPGPNLAYFSDKMSLKNITDHIYGRANMISRSDRPNMFIKELNIYIEYLKNKLEETATSMDAKQEKYFKKFSNNLNEGITYYHNLFNSVTANFRDAKVSIFNELETSKRNLKQIVTDIDQIKESMLEKA